MQCEHRIVLPGVDKRCKADAEYRFIGQAGENTIELNVCDSCARLLQLRCDVYTVCMAREGMPRVLTTRCEKLAS